MINTKKKIRNISLPRYGDAHKTRGLNGKLNQWETYYQQEIPASVPLYVQIATGTKCNLKCSFCTCRDGAAAAEYKNLSFREFLELSDPILFSSMVQLYGWGEPFVNPDYEAIFDHVTTTYPGICIYISTNGILLKEKWVQKLVSRGNVLVNISVNAATRETYKQVMKKDAFNQVMANIKNLNESIEKTGSSTQILLSFVTLRQNFKEIPAFVGIAADMHASVILQDLNVMDERHLPLSFDQDAMVAGLGDVLAEALQVAETKNVPLTAFGASRNTGSYYPPLPTFSASAPACPGDGQGQLHPGGGLCNEPWQRFMVGIDGTVTPCCYSNMVMGNVRETPWLDIWRGDAYRLLRRTVNSGTPLEDCLHCPMKCG